MEESSQGYETLGGYMDDLSVEGDNNIFGRLELKASGGPDSVPYW